MTADRLGKDVVMTIRKTLSLMALATCLSAPAMVHAAGATEVAYQPGVAQGNAEERVRTSVKIKMRAQSMSADSCHLQVGVNEGELATPFDAQIAEFEKYVSALINGDDSLNIPTAEDHRKTLHAASLVTEAWAPFKVAAMGFVEGTGGVDEASLMLEANYDLVHHGHNFTAQIVRQYANPAAATFADLLTIVIATRQGMLSQKMSKESCMVSFKGGDAAEKLAETMVVYENTLFALRDGLPAAGIAAAPTKEIKAGLTEAAEQWMAVKPILQQIADGADVGPEVHTDKLHKLDDMMNKMLEVSNLYVDHTKGKAVVN